MSRTIVYTHAAGRNDTWEVRRCADPANVCGIIDCIPTETAAENIAYELNRAYRLGYRECAESIRRTLDLYS